MRTGLLATLCLALLGVPALAQDAYEIGVGDVLGIAVFGQPAMSGEFTVNQQGMVDFPFIGRIKASGLTTSDVERKLATLLSEQGYLKRPQVDVTVKQYRSRRVFVIGEVKKPGPYGLRSDRSLISLMGDVGELTERAGHEVVVIRPGPPDPETGETKPARPLLPGEDAAASMWRIPLRDLFSGSLDRDVQLEIGDTVYVPKAASVYVSGHVAKPGPYPYEENVTVFEWLNRAGGVTDRGSARRVKILRLVEGKPKEISAKPTDVLLPEDTLKVPERFF